MSTHLNTSKHTDVVEQHYVVISSADIDPLKGRLLALAPLVKSSHRVEAMARGLGFGSYAALRAALARGAVVCSVDDREFSAFLRERGAEDVPHTTLSDAVMAPLATSTESCGSAADTLT